MAKNLEVLLKQRKWTGEDAGQLYLYSTINDIVHSRKNEKYDPIFDQDFFNKVTQKLPFLPKEQKDFNFYKRLDDAITSLEKDFRYYEQTFWRWLTNAMFIFNMIDDQKGLKSKINNLNISADEKNNLLSDLLTVDRLVNSDEVMPSKYYRTLLYESYNNIRMNLCFFYAINFTYTLLFEHLDFPQLNTLLINVNDYEQRVTQLNLQLIKILEGESDCNQKKFRLYYNEIDYMQLKPLDSYEEIVKAGLMFSKEPKETFVEGLSDMCMNLGNTFYNLNGGDK